MGYPDFSKISNYDQSFSLCFRSSPPLAYSRTRFQSSFFSLMSSYSSSLLGHSMQHMNIFLLFIFSFINSLIIEKKKQLLPNPLFPPVTTSVLSIPLEQNSLERSIQECLINGTNYWEPHQTWKQNERVTSFARYFMKIVSFVSQTQCVKTQNILPFFTNDPHGK